MRCRKGAAAAEMALVLPFLLIILCGSLELGNYFMDQHILAKGVRDGARYAARQSFTNYTTCSAPGSNPGTAAPNTISDNTKTIVRKGSLDTSGADLLPNWTDANAAVTVEVYCTTTTGSQTMGGIYTGANGAYYIKVKASLPYLPIIKAFGFSGSGFTLVAEHQSAVMGI